MVPVPWSHFLSLVRVYHKDKEGVLHSLQNFDLTKGILSAISRGQRSISTRFFTPGDLKRLKQIGVETESEVDLVVQFPWDGTSFLAVVAKANDTQLRRRVLAMAVDRIRKTASLKRILALKGPETCIVRENPYLGPGHAPYENFIESLLKRTDTSTPAGEKLLELFLKSAADNVNSTMLTNVEKLGLRMVFHGTNHAVMDAILKSGLDPNCRNPRLHEDYFGIHYSLSLGYSGEKTGYSPTCDAAKLLVFLIIEDPPFDSLHRTDGVVTVASNKCQLPLAEITLPSPALREEEDDWGEDSYEEDYSD